MDPDLEIARLAERYHGVVTRAQALRIGMSSRSIARRVELGAWERLHDGVYRLAGTPRNWEQTLLAACRAAGPGAVASHRAAAAVLSLPGGGKQVEISVPESRRVALAGVTVHRATRLERADRWLYDQIPVTSVARTVIDLAALLERDRLVALLDDVLARRLVPLPYLRSRLDALGCRGRKGAGALAGLLGERTALKCQPQSGFEWLLFRTLAAAGLPAPEPQYPVRLPGGRTAYLDFAYPLARLALEADSYLHHSSLTDWSLDRARNSDLVALGWRILAVTYPELEQAPEVIAARVGRALAAREPPRAMMPG
jgi:hypothetical protein